MKVAVIILILFSSSVVSYSCRLCGSKYQHLYSSVNSSEYIYVGKILEPKDSVYWFIEVKQVLKDTFIAPAPPKTRFGHSNYYKEPTKHNDTIFAGQLRTRYFGDYIPPRKHFIFSEHIHSFMSYEILSLEYLEEVMYLLDTTAGVHSVCEAISRLAGESEESIKAGYRYINENYIAEETDIIENIKQHLVEMRMNAFTGNDVKQDIGTSRRLLNVLAQNSDTSTKNFILSEVQRIEKFNPVLNEINLLDIPFMGETYLGEYLVATYASAKKDSLFQTALREEMKYAIKHSQTASSIYFVYALAKSIENMDFLLNLSPEQTEYALLGINYALEEDPDFTTYIWNEEYLKDLRGKLKTRIE